MNPLNFLLKSEHNTCNSCISLTKILRTAQHFRQIDFQILKMLTSIDLTKARLSCWLSWEFVTEETDYSITYANDQNN